MKTCLLKLHVVLTDLEPSHYVHVKKPGYTGTHTHREREREFTDHDRDREIDTDRVRT